MAERVDLKWLVRGCGDESFDDGIRIDTELAPLSGAGAPVKPAVYEGGVYQQDRRWASMDDDGPTPVIVIDNVPSQANRLEEALRRTRESTGIPELVLDLSALDHLPVHLPRRLSSLQFPHRNGDAYLRDAELDGQDFMKTELGQAVFGATAQNCGALMGWFPQALLYGFWQSHLGKKGPQTKHARAWVSEIIGWTPASTDTKARGLKGDMLNLSVDERISYDENDLTSWEVGERKRGRDAKPELSKLGHGQVLFMSNDDAAPAGVSFARITQRSTVSFAHLRRVSLGHATADADAAARALLVALGLHAHRLAFGRGFALRSGAELRPVTSTVTWLSAEGDQVVELGEAEDTGHLLQEAREKAGLSGVPLDGWGVSPTVLTPKVNLRAVIEKTWNLAD